MNPKKYSWLTVTVVYVFILLWLSCLKKLDEPPVYTGTNTKATISIRELRDSHIPGNFEPLLNNDIITGVIIANDATDNFYKTIVVQDSTAGMSVRLDGFGLSADYPLGMRVFIRLNGLWMGEYGGMLQLGGSVDRTDPNFYELIPIPSPLFTKVIVRGIMEVLPKPIKVQFDALKNTFQSRLVLLDSVEFAPSDTAKPFAGAINKATVSHTLRFCNGGSIYLRTSGFASFAALKTPRGNGTITGVYTIFGSQKQLVIRDTGDVAMTNLRCINNGPKLIFTEDFENISINSSLLINGWKNIAEAGGKFFDGKLVQGNRYAEISGFATNQSSIISWLILPAFNLSNSSNEVLSFVTKDAFDNGATLQIMVSTNYDGGNQPWKAKWTAVKAVIAKGSVNSTAANYTPSGSINLNAFNGNVYIAFKYEGNDLPSLLNKRTTTFQIDNVKVVGN